MATRKQYIREQVDGLLKSAGIFSAPVDVNKIAAHLDIDIRMQDTADAQISGCLVRKDGRAVIGLNREQSVNRHRFTIAHEIGHFLLHKGEKFHIDKAQAFYVNFRDGNSDPEEVEANFFAAELLMPTEFLTKEFDRNPINLSPEDEGSISKLAETYQVSVQALTYRLMNLGRIASGV